jgi:hypothetical protein
MKNLVSVIDTLLNVLEKCLVFIGPGLKEKCVVKHIQRLRKYLWIGASKINELHGILSLRMC